MRNVRPLRFGFVLLVLALAACGDKQEAKSPSQVLARVNGKEITVHQLNFVLARQPQPVTDEAKQKLVEQLVDQELLVQKAEELKLDRDPQVLQALEQSRRQLLAQAAAERVIGKPTEPTADARSKFYNENPALFSERRVYDFASFSVPAAAASDKALLASLQNVHTAAETEAALKAASVDYKAGRTRRAAEQLPMPLLARVATMQVGDIVNLPDGNGRAVLLQLEESRPAPVSEADAAPAITAYLRNGETEREARTKLADLRGKAQVEYVNGFAPTAQAAAPAAAVEATGQGTAEHLKAGVKGLK
ncbi:EpsD family peptidyl-prolyl cis-trans isomerase [Chitiniphilus eburneus]|uniref:peptidylprolyl isomerase n=1 Tax=Chitiniphilus eburneus TaxID=2571148 RepID=A0A4U0PJ84_9NEIS|nr:EpsD family peptidyl-prolyl cis-trans isomerase [Chitiniphilus eburneus]TJZ67997.1 peptidyl-prolyl cis-trans isomerase, EpsD family [Chitiniphilus eburneus]